MNLSGKKILIVRLGKIGDILIASAVLEVLKKKFPDVKISLLTLKKNKEVLKYNPNIDRIYFSNKNLFLYLKILLLKLHYFDFLLDLNDDPSTTSKLIRKILRVDTTIGFDFGESEKPGISVKRPSKEKTHILERTESLLGAMEISLSKEEFHPVLYIGEEEESLVIDQIKQFNDDYTIVAVNISTGAKIRNWGEENYSELLSKLVDNKYLKLIVLHLEDDKNRADRILKMIPEDYLIPMKYHSFQHFASYIRNADLIITPDTSAVQIASAFDVPVIALYSNVEWNYVSWQPLSSVKKSLRSKSESIKGISVDEVYSAFVGIQSQLTVK